MPLGAVFFDVGDTLVEGWPPRERMTELLREALRREFGERSWHEAFARAEIGPQQDRARVEAEVEAEERRLRQETLRWYEEWFRNMEIGMDDIDMDRLRAVMTLPLELISTPVPGAFAALRWCKDRGLRVVIVTNTLSRGDEEVWDDWRRFGLDDAIDGVVSSHTVGWQKPHRRIFERALEIAGTAPGETVMVGDRLDTDIVGAKRLGMRAVLRRVPHSYTSGLDVRPDAEIDDLITLPATLERWLGTARD